MTYSDRSDRRSGLIARNTFLLWGRMLVLAVINLYAVRVLVRALGDDDYGLYSAVAGVVSLLTCACTVLSNSTQRFYSYESVSNDTSRLNEIFCKSLNLNMVLSLVIILLLETVGLWYVESQLVVPDGRMAAVRWVYQFAIFSLACMLLQIPFMAAVLAHEDMGVYSIITTAECVLKLAVTFLIGLGGIDGMVFYGGGLFAVALLTFLSYVIVAGRRYGECRYHRQKDRSLYRELLLFSGWTFYGSAAGVATIQVNTLLLNRFFLPFINAAFSVATSVYNAFVQLCNSVVLAIRPAMIRSYAAGDHDGVSFMFSFCNKILFYVVAVIGIPLIIEMPLVMHVWLAERCTPEKILFARLMVGYVMVMAMQNPITIIMQASGSIKLYHLLCDSIIMMCIPTSWLLFRSGMPAYMILVSMTVFSVLAHAARLFCLKRNWPYFQVWGYLSGLIIPYMLFALVTFTVSFMVHRAIAGPLVEFAAVSAVSVSMLSLSVFFFGLADREKVYVKNFISRILRR